MMPHELELFIQDVAARVALRLGWDKNDVYGPYMEPMQRVSQPGPLTKYQCMKANLVWSFSPERVSELRNTAIDVEMYHLLDQLPPIYLRPKELCALVGELGLEAVEAS